MRKSLLDTSTYIDIQRGRVQIANTWAANTLHHAANYVNQHGKLCISTLTVLEIAHGITTRAQSLQAFRRSVLPMFDIIDFDAEAACLAGEIYSKLEFAGLRIGVADTAVAAISLTHRLTLVTSNNKHFQRVIDVGYVLRLENWRNP